MELKTFKEYLINVRSEGNRLQKVNIKGDVITTRRFTQMQLVGIFFSLSCLYFLPEGFPEKFAGYTISFLGIFVGMFSSSVIALINWSTRLKATVQTSDLELINLKKSRNHIIQFTGLTAYGILLAFLIIILMLFSLAHKSFSTDIKNYYPVLDVRYVSMEVLCNFLRVSIVLVHRFITVYFLFNFFSITIYSVTSYFSHILSEYKRIKLDNDSD